MNRMELIGRVGQDAQTKYTASGVCLFEVSVADNRTKGEKKITQWINVIVWGHLAESLGPYVKKGCEVVAIGEYEIQEWTDKSGNKKSRGQLNAQYFRVCQYPLLAEKKSESKQPEPVEPPPAPMTEDDVPF